MTLQEINIDKLPIVIISDCHCKLENLQKVKSLYPHYKIISLGDNCDLYARNSNSNQLIIQWLIDNNIQSTSGNHEEHISGVVNGTTIMFLDNHNNIDINYYNIPQHQCEWLKELPRGFKLNLPDGKYYLLYHHLPLDVWSFKDQGKLTKQEFIDAYKFDDNCLSVIHGHLHLNFMEEFPNLSTTRISLGALKFGWYAIINEDGVNLNQL